MASKRKLNTKSIKDKYQASKEVEEGKSKLQFAAKYGIPKNTLSTWIKNKDKIFEAAQKGMITKRHRLRAGSYEKLDQAIFKWLLTVRSRDVAVLALILKTKAVDFAEKMSIENFHASDGWLDHWKKRYNVSFKKISGEGNACTDEMTAPFLQRLRCQPCYLSMNSTRSTVQTSLVCFIVLSRKNLSISRMKDALVVSTVSFD